MANRITSKGQCYLACTSSLPWRFTFTQMMQEVLGQLFGICSRKARERISLVAFRIGTRTAYALTWLTHSPCTKGSFSQRKGSEFVVALGGLVEVMLRGCELLCTYFRHKAYDD